MLSQVIEDLNDLITVVFVIINDICQEIIPEHIKNRRNINKCIMSDSKITHKICSLNFVTVLVLTEFIESL
ncbi:hypothetical protein [Clostridium sp. Marseille-Q2269]|uniref:hypothetical protein n=1 Tax=Clostridium sp. Marseille-Q2269 TaxID=2942205 RepID=UPI00207477D1|nr:hypothetical protein [Clostridium sp. Marseille-Q2269]